MNAASINVIFFDLDNTLFDHTRAERSAILSLIASNPEIFHAIDPDSFVQVYHQVNKVLWKKMAAGEITSEELKHQRFEISLNQFNRQTNNADALSKQYFEFYSSQTCAHPNTREILAYLKPKYHLGILSNGFPEIQERKLCNLRVGSHFKFKIYSGEVGAMKPAPEIFQAAMQRCGAKANEIVYVGDSFEDDIKGAKAVGWQVIHFNPTGEKCDRLADHEIRNLIELKTIF